MSERLLALDARLSNQLRVAERPGPLRTFAAILAHSGDSWFWLLGLLLIWYFGTPEWRDLAIAMALGVVITAAVVTLIKFSVRRSRPAGEWGTIYRRTDPHSFPSGHAARAAMLAVVAIGFGPAWLAGVMVIWAPLVSLARISMGLHYLSDVLAGMVLGMAIGLGIMLWF